MKSINKLINYIKKKYNDLEEEMIYIGGNKNINRHTRLSMSGYVENAIAILIDDILSKKGKKYNYLVDVQLIVDKKTYRPDIIIYDDNNVIYGMVEVKAQLGYSGNFNKDNSFIVRENNIINGRSIMAKDRKISDKIFDLTNEIKVLSMNKEKNKELIKTKREEKNRLLEKEGIPYTLDKKCKDMVIILMSTNSHKNFNNFKDLNSYVLFLDDQETVWYNNLNEKHLNTNTHTTDKYKNHTYEKLVDYLEKNF